jgi:hypothetical protein
MLRWLVALTVCLLSTCQSPLPSTTPLGTGPLALVSTEKAHGDGAQRARSKDADAAATDSEPASTAAEDPEEPTADGSERSFDLTVDVGVEADASIPTDAAAPPAFAGHYVGPDFMLYRFAGTPDRRVDDPNAKVTIELAGASELRVTLVDSSNGDPICTLTAAISGSSATVAAGQDCFTESNDETDVTGTVTRGSLTLTGDRLELEIELDFTMATEYEDLRGTLEYWFGGRRR